MSRFAARAEAMVAAMETHAHQVDAAGVIVVAFLTEDGASWDSRMKVVGRLKLMADPSPGQTVPGYNFLAIAYSKAAEMADSRVDSGSLAGRPVLQGEFGYQGGVIRAVPGGFVLAVFSGASGNLDTEISQQGWQAYECT